jgi:hypothetical protein
MNRRELPDGLGILRIDLENRLHHGDRLTHESARSEGICARSQVLECEYTRLAKVAIRFRLPA